MLAFLNHLLLILKLILLDLTLGLHEVFDSLLLILDDAPLNLKLIFLNFAVLLLEVFLKLGEACLIVLLQLAFAIVLFTF